ncbi:MAG TPA: hypothetical protein VHV26_00600 [Rhizomicrobium sp.]|nr:hypothetical protein [Rhizomicrobium sp.]
MPAHCTPRIAVTARAATGKSGAIGKHMDAGRDSMAEADEGEPDKLLGLSE